MYYKYVQCCASVRTDYYTYCMLVLIHNNCSSWSLWPSHERSYKVCESSGISFQLPQLVCHEFTGAISCPKYQNIHPLLHPGDQRWPIAILYSCSVLYLDRCGPEGGGKGGRSFISLQAGGPKNPQKVGNKILHIHDSGFFPRTMHMGRSFGLF